MIDAQRCNLCILSLLSQLLRRAVAMVMRCFFRGVDLDTKHETHFVPETGYPVGCGTSAV